MRCFITLVNSERRSTTNFFYHLQSALTDGMEALPQITAIEDLLILDLLCISSFIF